MKILAKTWKFCKEMEILAKNGNFGQKWKFWPKMEILYRNQNFTQNFKMLKLQHTVYAAYGIPYLGIPR